MCVCVCVYVCVRECVYVCEIECVYVCDIEERGSCAVERLPLCAVAETRHDRRERERARDIAGQQAGTPHRSTERERYFINEHTHTHTLNP